ncbi:MAG: DUF2125 domain-containing protein [Rhodospirillaceae bacterium]|nr:DUF2125 domain-containing protein [Rhodospirillaceae bacterium]
MTEDVSAREQGRKRALAWTGGLFIAAVALYAGAWLATALLLQNQARDWIAAQRDAGTMVEHTAPRVGGFPGRAVVTLPGWRMSRPVTAGGWSWRTTEVRLWAHPWRPLSFTVDLAGAHELAGAFTPPGVAARIALARLDIAPVLTARGQLAAVTATLAGAAVTDGASGTRVFALDAATLIAEPRPDSGSFHLAASATGMAFPEAEVAPFATDVRTLRLVADLTGPLELPRGPDAPLTKTPLTQALEAWRQAGGTLELRELTLDWPPVALSGSGTVSLDENLQPIGAAAVRFNGFFETVDGLADTGAVRPATASMARVILGLLARTPPGGGPPELSVSVTAQDGKLYAGPLALMELPPVDWSRVDLGALP